MRTEGSGAEKDGGVWKKPYILRQENQNCRLQGKKEREFVIQHLCLNVSTGEGKHSAKIKGKRSIPP